MIGVKAVLAVLESELFVSTVTPLVFEFQKIRD